MNIKTNGGGFTSSKYEFNDTIVNSIGEAPDFSSSEIVCNGKTVLNGYQNRNNHLILNDQSRVDNAWASALGTLIINSAEVTYNCNFTYILQSYDSTDSVLKTVAGSKISLKGQVYQLQNDLNYTLKADGNKDLKETPPQYQKVEGETYTQPDLSWLDELATPQTYQKKDDDKQYGEIIKQYDSLIKDSSYKGINLLREQDLTVTFNENRSAQLSVQGKDASAKALGLVTTDWQNQGDVVKSIQELTDALNQIRQMSSELGNYYSIVTTRENFTQNLIKVLTEGEDKLTLADMNEESANMLALQTRQQLAVNSLSLASQASQSILKLF